jgi:hypothetical protein
VLLGRYLTAFQRAVLPSAYGVEDGATLKIETVGFSKYWCLSIKLHCITSYKTVIVLWK